MKKVLFFVFAFLFSLILSSCSKVCFDESKANHIHHGKHYSLVEPSCVSQGQKDFYQCEQCGNTFFEKPSCGKWVESNYFFNVSSDDDRYIPPLGHSFDSGIVIINPTRFTEGKKQFTCLRCGELIEEPILPLVNSSLSFEEINYETILGEAVFDNSILKSSASCSLVINKVIEFQSGCISSIFHCGNGENVGGIVFASDESASCYYSVNLETCGRLNLLKKQRTKEKCISFFRLPYFSPLISYKIDVFFSNGRILCFVNDQFCIDYYDNLSLNGSKIGFLSYNHDSYISSISLSKDVIKNNYIDFKQNSLVRRGSFFDCSSSEQAVVIYKFKLKRGTVIRFIGDYSVYEWKAYQFFDFDVIPNDTEPSVENAPFFVDSLWNSSNGFLGCDKYTFALSQDSFLCLNIRRFDCKTLDDYEINNVLNMFGIIGEISSDDDNNLVLSTAIKHGDAYNWLDDTVVTLRILQKMPIGTTIKFTGSCSLYKWSVIEMKHCHHYDVNIANDVDNIYDSNWNNALPKSKGFEGDNKYSTITNNSYLDVRLSFVDGKEMSSFSLYEVFDLFIIGNNTWCTFQDKRNDIVAINHRGYNFEAPENTLSAFAVSKEKGFDRVEADVSCTEDGVPVLLHDDSINRTARTADGDIIQQEILIENISFDEVRKYDFGIWKNDNYKGEKIPSFEEYIELCKRLQLHPYIELKGTLSSKTVADCVRIVNKYGMEKQCTWISFYSDLLSAVRFYSECARIGVLTGSNSLKLFSKLMALITDSNAVFIDQYFEDESMKYSAMINSAEGIPLEVWTVDSIDDLAYIPIFISGVTSNCLTTQDLRLMRYM